MKPAVACQPLSKFLKVHLSMFLNNIFKKFDRPPPSGKNPSPVDPSPNFYCFHQRFVPPLNNNFHVISQKNFIFSCSHCSCTIFISPLYTLHTQVMPMLILTNIQIVDFSFERGLNG